MYAIIQTGGKQYRVSEGDVIKINRLKGNLGDPIEFTQVIMLEDNGHLRLKQGDVKGTKVTGKIIGKTNGKKIRVFRYRRRKNTMRTKGCRPKCTMVSIDKILTV